MPKDILQFYFLVENGKGNIDVGLHYFRFRYRFENGSQNRKGKEICTKTPWILRLLFKSFTILLSVTLQEEVFEIYRSDKINKKWIYSNNNINIQNR